jgi:hypothetical protein
MTGWAPEPSVYLAFRYLETEPRFPVTVLTELPELLIPGCPQIVLHPVKYRSVIICICLKLLICSSWQHCGHTGSCVSSIVLLVGEFDVQLKYSSVSPEPEYEQGTATSGHGHLVYKTDFNLLPGILVGRDNSVGVATRYGLDGPGIEPRCRRDFPHESRSALGPTQPPIQ